MIHTKEKFCKAVLQPYMREYNAEKFEDLIPHVYGSSIMGICLQELGYISDPETIAYLNSRGGTVLTYADKNGDVEILSFRELLDHLYPESKNKEE